MNGWWSVAVIVGRIVTVGMILGGAWWYVQSAERMRQENKELVAQVVDQQEKLLQNEQAVQLCLKVNQYNYEQALNFRAVAEKAVQEVIVLQRQADELVEALKDQTEDFENDQNCRRLSDPLPSNFVEWLRN